MGKIVANFFIALDGVVEAPESWHMSYINDEMMAVIGAGMERNKAFLMGRKGYDGWAAYWPTSTDEPYASYFNDIPKYVISSTLRDPSWKNTTVLPGEAGAVRQLKESVDGDILMTGSTVTVRWLLANGLLDELRLLLHPVAVGSGQKLFEDGMTQKLDLVHSQAFSTGVLDLVYRPAS
ncbi:dihydrofolate reductase [Nonomuraea sp. NN258]|uniref:dihydrofolate reductase family protein n=1 Tax=Nonomuraea antri TaxID=2730852 RepID=UPI001567F725|nr:dihydrofolate reductase family protein [Nonomuraea antri]NRQ35901.1 dihydrofolate reductase [Nonomuraea antri]